MKDVEKELEDAKKENDFLKKENTFLKQQLFKIKTCCKDILKYIN